MPDFQPNSDRAADCVSNALRSLGNLKEILLQNFPETDIRIAFLELAIADSKLTRYQCDGNPDPLMPPTISLQSALADMGVRFDG